MPSVDIEQVKAANPIQDVIGETEPMRTERGRYMRAQKHDSLVVDVQGQYYTWNSKGGETGDVIDWIIRYRQVGDFKSAVEWLCRRGGLPSPEWNGDGGAERVAARAREDAFTVYARWAVHQLRASKAALDYARGRGWTDETIRAAGLGFSGEAKARKDLLGEFSMHEIDTNSPGAKAVLSIPPGMLVYPHVKGGRVRYVSARAVAEKRHYNVEEQHAGPRQPYFNSGYAPGEAVIVVEGQADAVTVGQWGLGAIALAGTALSDELVATLRKHRLVYWATDADEAGQKAREQARLIGPLTRLLTWPDKDANAWLQSANPSEDDVRGALRLAPTVVEWVCECAGKAGADERDDAILDAMRVVAQLPKEKLTTRQDALIALLGIKKAPFNALLKTLTEEAEAEEEPGPDDEQPAIEVTGAMEVENYFMDVLYDARTDEFRLAVRHPDGRIESRSDFEMRGFVYRPGAHPHLLKELKQPANQKEPPAILMPSDVPEQEMSVGDLHQAIMDFSRDYLDVDENHRRIAAYYVMITWVYDCFREIGYLRAMGPTGKGKSRYVSTLGSICYRPLFMLGLSTLSPMFRIRALTLSTLIVDEINGPFVESPAELELYFNAGMSVRSPRVWRSEGKEAVPTSFSGAYGPKIFGSIKGFRDPATNNRCMTVEMTMPTSRTDIKDQDSEFDRRAQELRNQLMRFRMKYWKREWQLQKWLDPTIEPRLRQITEPLLTVIGDDANTVRELQTMIRHQNAELAEARNDSIAAKVVRSLVELAAKPARLGKQGRIFRDARLKVVYDRVRELVFDEEEAPPALRDDGTTNTESPRNDKKHWINRFYSPRRIGEVVRRELGMQTIEADWAAGKGRSVDLVSDEQLAKLEQLRVLYGVTLDPKPDDSPEPPPLPDIIPDGPDEYLDDMPE